jgi:hypothetical protein
MSVMLEKEYRGGSCLMEVVLQSNFPKRGHCVEHYYGNIIIIITQSTVFLISLALTGRCNVHSVMAYYALTVCYCLVFMGLVQHFPSNKYSPSSSTIGSRFQFLCHEHRNRPHSSHFPMLLKSNYSLLFHFNPSEEPT